MNQLRHIKEFKAALKDYHLGEETLHTLSQTKLVLLVAATSSGRNTIIHEVLRTGDYHYVISDTTRKPRINDGILEQNGREYWFKTEEEFLENIHAGRYLEAAVIHNQQMAGISVEELRRAQDEGKIAITDAEIAGADNATKYKPDTISIFILPPSFDEWQKRLKHRGHMEAGEFVRRMQSACREFEVALQRDYYHFVINDTVEEAATEINHIAKLGASDAEQQQRGRRLAEQLLVETQALLKSLS